MGITSLFLPTRSFEERNYGSVFHLFCEIDDHLRKLKKAKEDELEAKRKEVEALREALEGA